MKLSYFPGYVDVRSILMPLESIVELIRSNQTICEQTREFRFLSLQGKSFIADRIKATTPCFAVAVRFQPVGKAKKDIEVLTGLSLVDIDHIPVGRMQEVIRLVNADPHTLLSYTTISEKGLRILFRIEGLTDQPPTTANLKRYATAFEQANRYYAELTGCECDLKCKNATRLSGLAHDANVFFNPNATPFGNEELRIKNKRFFDDALNDNTQRGCKVSPRLLAFLRKELASQNVVYEAHHHNEYIMRMGYLMNAFGVNLEAATQWAIQEFSDYDGDVSGIFRSCYQQTEEFGTRQLPVKASKKSKKPSFASVAEIETFLDGEAMFRHNLVTNKVEYCHADETSPVSPSQGGFSEWRELDDRFVNSLWARMCKQVKPVKVADLRAVLASEFVPPFHPFKHYFLHLPPWNGQTDYITELADTVTVKGDEQPFFRKYFKKWLVNVVASMLEPEIVNHEILVFIGPQGCYKTSWMNHLLPPKLRRFFYLKENSNRITKDDLFTVTEFALICLEELDALHTSDMNQLKALVSKPEINERAAYGHYKERRPHLASFCGTTNNVQFLTDLTGNRRWLPIEVERILDPFTHSVNYEGVYSQAFALFKNGFEYFLSPDEVKEVNLRNHHYEVPCLEVELVQMMFEVPRPNSKGIIFLTTAQILHRINGWVKHLLSPTKIGIAMVKAGFKPIRRGGKRGYIVIELDAERIKANAKLLGLS